MGIGIKTYRNCGGGKPLNQIVAENAEAFGDATVADVLNGKTFTSQSGLRLAGEKVDLDTSDATATAGDILLGKTAYANGARLTGSLEKGKKCAVGTFTGTGKYYVKVTGVGFKPSHVIIAATYFSRSTISFGTSGRIVGASTDSDYGYGPTGVVCNEYNEQYNCEDDVEFTMNDDGFRCDFGTTSYYFDSSFSYTWIATE